MGFGIIIIGDELLSGKRKDTHLQHTIATLSERGLELSWAQILSDDPVLISTFLEKSLATDDIVFSFGGIGATPDDHTRMAAAKGAGVELELHPEAVEEIEQQFGDQAYPTRIRMAKLPEGCKLIPNSYNRIPGFSLANHHFLPGFPIMAWPMMEWVLDTYYANLSKPADIEQLFIVEGTLESQLVPLMEQFVATHPELRFSSLPHIGKERRIELGIRGNPELLPAASETIRQGLKQLGIGWKEKQIDHGANSNNERD